MRHIPECLILFNENAITDRVKAKQPFVMNDQPFIPSQERLMTKAKLVFDPFSQDYFNGAYETTAGCETRRRSTTTTSTTSTL